MDTFDQEFKVVVVGHINTGKSSFVNYLVHEVYQENPVSTTNVQFYEKIMNVTQSDGTESKVKLKIWDTAGAERYKSITSTYIRGSQIIFLFIDVSCRESFEELSKTWWKLVSEYLGSSIIVLICNKSDLLNEKTKTKNSVTEEEIKSFCSDPNNFSLFNENTKSENTKNENTKSENTKNKEKLNVNHSSVLKSFLVSSKNGENVKEAADYAIKEYFRAFSHAKVINKAQKIDIGQPLGEENQINPEDEANLDGKKTKSGCGC
ncbi:Ras family protein [Tritrichomonas foetus]|uniref:Ras family protein n=1 Tax=Tritrichomonas foetus TaxID=1144522 RepID=A0A1J4KQL0_9EUKA|nr:Ras family protein [Tritrichomonas foetus]|eukprot:OHT12076.1 Ras family protein [Tritrichomonas foetus]